MADQVPPIWIKRSHQDGSHLSGIQGDGGHSGPGDWIKDIVAVHVEQRVIVEDIGQRHGVIDRVYVAFVRLVGCQQIPFLLVRALVFLLEVLDCARVQDGGELLAVEVHPVEVAVVAEHFVGAARAVVHFSSARVGQNAIRKGDLLEFRVGPVSDILAHLV